MKEGSSLPHQCNSLITGFLVGQNEIALSDVGVGFNYCEFLLEVGLVLTDYRFVE